MKAVVLPRMLLFNEQNGCYYHQNRKSQYVNHVEGNRVTTDLPDEYKGAIYFMGFSQFYGVGVEDANTIPSYMQRLINEKYGKSSGYLVQNYANGSMNDNVHMINNLKSAPLKKGDIVIFHINCHKLTQKDLEKENIYINMQDVLNRPHAYGEVFLDFAHFNHVGCKVIAQNLFHRFVKNNMFENQEVGVPKAPEGYATVNRPTTKMVALPQQESEELEAYIKSIRQSNTDESGVKGSIVMNCNPFTLGHRYLIEKAASQVDKLYVFVVEEDKSFFPFQDRLELVRQGTSDLKNVVVLPSGRFIISSVTFESYFKKEELSEEEIDPSTDVTIFAQRIAPALDISIRFVGEEPLCNITRQYNQSLKNILPQYNIQLQIIPRVESGGAPISASRVRALLEKKDFDQITTIVPSTTLLYLKKRFGNQ